MKWSGFVLLSFAVLYLKQAEGYQMYAGINYCVACMGSLYPLCQTNLTDFSCRSEMGDSECKTNTY